MTLEKHFLVSGLLVGLISLVFVGAFQPAAAAKDDGERFRMSQVANGFVRLDTQTGAMAFCKRKAGKWSCRPMDDTAGANSDEVARLRAENADLKDLIARLEASLGPDGRGPDGGRGSGSGAGPGSGPGDGDQDNLGPEDEASGAPTRPEIQLPSEEQVDQAVDYLERMIRKFRDRFEQFGDRTQPKTDRGGQNSDENDDPTQL